ncbi:MAG: hypothetical protein AAF393_02005 [Pseudomonadota bacterium]
MIVLDAAALIDAAYEDALGSSTQKKPDSDGVQAYLMRDGTLVIPGTNELSDWRRYNMNVYDRKIADAGGGYRFHSGFLRHASAIYTWVKNKRVKRVTGHSLGAASGQILGAKLNLPVINFASPKVSLKRYRYSNEIQILNFNRKDDRVTKAPRWGFRHVGQVVWLSQPGGNFGGDHKVARYVELLKDPRYAHLPKRWPVPRAG